MIEFTDKTPDINLTDPRLPTLKLSLLFILSILCPVIIFC